MEQDLLLIIPPPAKGRSSVSLYDCFDIWNEFEVLPNYQCPDYPLRKNDDVVRMNVFKKGGDILLIVLRRFDPDRNKIHTEVEYPIQLDISRITGDSSNRNTYALSGVIHHHGETPQTGHYVSQFFHEEHREWVDANDRSVVKHQGALETVSGTAYILLYQLVEPKKVPMP
jgi:ubiquitin C-terminal hydrolase